jgi:hypothetical protein
VEMWYPKHGREPKIKVSSTKKYDFTGHFLPYDSSTHHCIASPGQKKPLRFAHLRNSSSLLTENHKLAIRSWSAAAGLKPCTLLLPTPACLPLSIPPTPSKKKSSTQHRGRTTTTKMGAMIDQRQEQHVLALIV